MCQEKQRYKFRELINLWDIAGTMVLGEIVAATCIVFWSKGHNFTLTQLIIVACLGFGSLIAVISLFIKRLIQLKKINGVVTTPKYGIPVTYSPDSIRWLKPNYFDVWAEETITILTSLRNTKIALAHKKGGPGKEWEYFSLLEWAQDGVSVELRDWDRLVYQQGNELRLAAELAWLNKKVIEIAIKPWMYTERCSEELCVKKTKRLFCHGLTHLLYYRYGIGFTARSSHVLMEDMDLPWS